MPSVSQETSVPNIEKILEVMEQIKTELVDVRARLSCIEKAIGQTESAPAGQAHSGQRASRDAKVPGEGWFQWQIDDMWDHIHALELFVGLPEDCGSTDEEPVPKKRPAKRKGRA